MAPLAQARDEPLEFLRRRRVGVQALEERKKVGGVGFPLGQLLDAARDRLP